MNVLQIKTVEAAMKMLKSKLYQLKLEEQAREMAEIRGEQKEIGWEAKLDHMFFHPYSMVKDHRTNEETGKGWCSDGWETLDHLSNHTFKTDNVPFD